MAVLRPLAATDRCGCPFIHKGRCTGGSLPRRLMAKDLIGTKLPTVATHSDRCWPLVKEYDRPRVRCFTFLGICVVSLRGYIVRNAWLGDFVVVRTSYSVLKPRQYSLLHT